MLCSALSRPSQTMVSIIFEDVIRFVRVNVSQDFLTELTIFLSRPFNLWLLAKEMFSHILC